MLATRIFCLFLVIARTCAFVYTSPGISAGGVHTCGIEKDTELAKCWGVNSENRATPPADVKFVAISAGYAHTCGIEKGTELANEVLGSQRLR